MSLTQKISFIIAVPFLLFWILAMATALTAGACINGHYHGETKLRYCDISIALGAFLPKEPGKRSIVYLERGIVNFGIGNEIAAKVDFFRAISDASADIENTISKSYWLQRLIDRMEKEGNESRSFRLWESVVSNL